VVEYDQIQERDYALFDINNPKAGWKKCSVPAALGIPLFYKRLLTTKAKDKQANKFGYRMHFSYI
jgi:hypothetical protein